MNDLYEAARRRLAELREEERTLNEFIVSHDRARRLLGGVKQASLFEGEPPAPAPLPAPVPPFTIPDFTAGEGRARRRRPRVTGNPPSAVILKAAVSALRDHGRPMSRRELHAALADRGVHVKGTDPVKALGTILWRGGDLIESREGQGYWPKGDPGSPGNYPADIQETVG